MAYLRVIYQNREREKVELTAHPFSIGRLPENTLVLHDRTVSRRHAVLHFDAQKKCWIIENLSATNPIRLNGKILEGPTVLFDGDEIAIGLYRLAFSESPG